LYIELNDIKLDLRVSYSAKGDEWYNSFLSTSGDASCRPSASGTGLLVLGTSDGKPTVRLSQPPSVRIDIGSVNIEGSWIGWLVELLVPIFQGTIESAVQTEIGKAIQAIVNNDLSEILAKLELLVEVPVPPPFDNSAVSFSVSSISTRSDDTTVDLSVAIVDPNDPTRLVRQPVSTVIPDIKDVNKMLSVSLVPEVIEDIVRFHQGKWNYTLQKNDVPAESPLALDSESLALLTTLPLTTLFGQKDMQLTVSLDGLLEVTFG